LAVKEFEAIFVAAVAIGATRSDTVLLATNVDPSNIAMDP
jgi:hypothetical protein